MSLVRFYTLPLKYYVKRLREGSHFSFAGYSDAEWYCILGERVGGKTGLGQVIDAAHGVKLLDVLRRRQADPRFLVAVPKCLWGLPAFGDRRINRFLDAEGIHLTLYERDMVLDSCAERAGLFPLIDQLRRMRTVMIGPAALHGMRPHLGTEHLIEISTPNVHLEPGGIERAVREALALDRCGVYLVSAGVSAAVIIDRLHDAIPNSWFIDCGSIWDGFVGIGGQRQWRAELYRDKSKWQAWKEQNLYGKREPGA